MTYSQMFHQILYFPLEFNLFLIKKYFLKILTFVKYDIISVKLAQVLLYIAEALRNLLVYLEGTLCTLNNASPKTGRTFQCDALGPILCPFCRIGRALSPVLCSENASTLGLCCTQKKQN